jgi:hypothetical protein
MTRDEALRQFKVGDWTSYSIIGSTMWLYNRFSGASLPIAIKEEDDDANAT